MKRFFLTIVATLMLSVTMSAQNVARECVLFEVFTGVNCPYCPAAANGIAQMLEEGLSIAPIAYHTSAFSTDQFYTSETNARASYYSISSYPTLKADGILTKQGGGTASQSLYSNYLPFYNQRIAVESPFTIDLSFDYHSGTQCEAKAVVTQVGDCNSTDVRVFIVMTESHIQRPWQGMQEVNFVVRDMIPNQNGTPFTGGTQEITGLFDMGGYNKENCELVAWVQSYNGTKEVYQAVRLSIAQAGAQYDMGVVRVEEVVSESCSGLMAPRFTVKNYGTETINSILFEMTDESGNDIGEYQWEGTLNQGQETEFVMPEINIGDATNLIISAVDINNGNDDQYAFDNNYSIEIADAQELEGGFMKIQLRTGSDPENFSIEIKNMDTDEVVETFTYEEASQIYQHDITLPELGCYRVTFRNSAGNGSGGGFFGIKDKNNQTIFMGSNTENQFRYELAVEMTYSVDGIEDVQSSEVNIYPNPASTSINVNAANLAKVDVYNSVGQLIYSQNVDNDNVMINSESWANGLYYINLETKDGVKSSQKVVVNK